MRNPTLFLRICYVSIFITAACVILLFEGGMLTPPHIADDASRYVLNIVGVALTLALLPLGLKVFTLSLPRRQGAASVGGYVRWAVVRLTLLSVPLYFNILAFYLLDRYATCGWMALMAAVMFMFVWPSDGRMRYERATAYPQDEKQ